MSEAAPLTPRQQQILEFIDQEVRRRGYPPSVREIGEAVGLSSSSTVHAHLAALQDKGYLRRDPTKPRAIEVCFEPGSGAVVDRRPVVHVPLVGDVAAGTGVLAAENIEETMPLPEDLTGDGQLFMLRVRGDSMIEAGHLRPRLRGGAPAADRRQRRHRRGGHPRRGGHGQDLPRQAAARSRCDRRTPRSRTWCSSRPRSPSSARSSRSCAACSAVPDTSPAAGSRSSPSASPTSSARARSTTRSVGNVSATTRA